MMYFPSIQQVFTKHYVPSIVLSAEDKAVSKTNMVAPLMELSMGHGGVAQATRPLTVSCEWCHVEAGAVLGAFGRSTISKMPTISCSTQTPILGNSDPNRYILAEPAAQGPPLHSLSDQGWTCNPQGPIHVLAGDL